MKNNKFRKSFRKNKETQHPAYLVNENEQGYDYIGLTHSPTTNDKENIKLNQNLIQTIQGTLILFLRLKKCQMKI